MSTERRLGVTRLSRSCRAATVAAVAVAAALLVGGCERERRDFGDSPPSPSTLPLVRMSALQPGLPTDTTRRASVVQAGFTPGLPVGATDRAGPYDRNAFAVSEGQRLFGWYNCVGCHSHGGGGMGPALMDDRWIYGSSAANIYATIVEGRPNGMPSFGGRIPPQQLWQIVAYVRSLSGLTPSDTRGARGDEMMVYPGSQTLRAPEKPISAALPPAARRP